MNSPHYPFPFATIALLTLAFATAVGQAPSSSPGISGHVYSATDGRPLASVVVTLEQGGKVGNDQRQLTSADGSFYFANLNATDYILVAFRSDLIGQIYGSTHWGFGPSSSNDHLNLQSGKSVTDADFHLRPAPTVLQMPTAAFAKAYPQRFADINAIYGRFSPDGTLLAIATSGIASGDPEQVWLYDIKAQRLFPVTAPVAEDSRIHALGWVGQTLFVDADRAGHSHYFIKATASGTEEIPAVPTDARAAFAVLGSSMASESDDLIIQNYKVAIGRLCHGCDLDLTATSLVTSKRSHFTHIPFEYFVFDPTQPVVFYPLRSWNTTIVALNLETRQSNRLDLPMHRFSNLVAARREERGFLVAYAVTSGSCTPELTPYGEDAALLPFNRNDAKHPMNICLVHVPDQESSTKQPVGPSTR